MYCLVRQVLREMKTIGNIVSWRTHEYDVNENLYNHSCVLPNRKIVKFGKFRLEIKIYASLIIRFFQDFDTLP